MHQISEVESSTPRRRGSPRGTTAQGAATRQRLYETAIRLVASRGWEATTLRDVAAEAGVSVGLLYRYYPSKHAVLQQLYDEICAEYTDRLELPHGRWRHRFVYALRRHVDVLRPHRAVLTGLLPVLVGTSESGLFGSQAASARGRVLQVFQEAVAGANDAPAQPVAAALGRLLYLVNLCVILWWTLEKTPGQRATDQLVALIEEALRPFGAVIRIPVVRRLLLRADALVAEALLGEPSS